MIKAIAGTTLILGISEHNVELLRQDKPIRVDLNALGLKGIETVVVFHGRDDQHLYEQMKPMIGMNTIIHSDQAGKN